MKSLRPLLAGWVLLLTSNLTIEAQAEFVEPLVELQIGEHPTLADMLQISWEGLTGYTFFMQHSTDLQTWTYLDIIETGEGTEISYGFESTAETDFWRLHYIDVSVEDPEGADFDHDGLSNSDELTTHGTSPLFADTDGDGFSDKWEIDHSFDPLTPAEDTDADGLWDEWEMFYFSSLSQTGSGDPDSDGLTNEEELLLGRNPTVGAITGTAAELALRIFLPGR